MQNNDDQLDNLSYSYTADALTAQAYVQYADVKAHQELGFTNSGSTTGWGVLANYAVPNTNLNLAGRVEYISSSGSPTDGSPNLLYGPGSSAWSFTFTPTYQSGVLFTRAEISLVQANGVVSGFGFGSHGSNTEQFRFAVETGILF